MIKAVCESDDSVPLEGNTLKGYELYLIQKDKHHDRRCPSKQELLLNKMQMQSLPYSDDSFYMELFWMNREAWRMKLA